MMMAPAQILILSLYIICAAAAEDLKEESFISVNAGENVTLLCKVEKPGSAVKAWYKQSLWQKPKEVASKLDNKNPVIPDSKFSLNGEFSLSIKETSEDDEGMYFCGKSDGKTFTFSNIIFLTVTGRLQFNISVHQTPVQGPVSPGEPVTLQCTVLSDLRAADLRVLWFRAAAGQSFPEIIHTHQNSSSRQCEISSSTHSSVYNFSRNILNHHHTGTYYCAVAACGRITIGDGGSVHFGKQFLIQIFNRKWRPVDPVVIVLVVALGVCMGVIPVQTYIIWKRRNGGDCGGQIDISVLQPPSKGSVSPGESVTLQCTVLSEIRAADLRVLWFRAAAGQSFPEIIYTHQNSSSRQCEISSSTHSSVYSFSRNILNHHHTGTYYCAVAACGRIIFGNGTAVELSRKCIYCSLSTLCYLSI
ncbi:hypothetical protein NFI96_016004 [Prochilodus magdalenae]|nr:hypothetical protein NFI96_016004 [Prochilodus magdalenae]